MSRLFRFLITLPPTLDSVSLSWFSLSWFSLSRLSGFGSAFEVEKRERPLTEVSMCVVRSEQGMRAKAKEGREEGRERVERAKQAEHTSYDKT